MYFAEHTSVSGLVAGLRKTSLKVLYVVGYWVFQTGAKPFAGLDRGFAYGVNAT